ncbi:hypothetical protein LXM94_01115 [Rhizobium sp. TRM95111]|uniref:hypothetical protein n=1 Tax=Rhizobium alarense TaxID=2846851 RepID=UPI001F180048|nr:hypothetical protein [Rhizobium alarense]MCF3638568.1 hypothetical protein [Rhizobium alarense]
MKGPAMRTAKTALLIALPIAAAATPALASSDDAWEAFRADVEKACVAALPEKFRKPTVHVDPTGTERFGIALVAGRSQSEKMRVSYVCVYDKQAKTVELTGAIGPEFVRVLNDKQRAKVLERRAAAAKGETSPQGAPEDDAEE